MMAFGFRKVRTFKQVTEAEVDRHGAFGYFEVENPGEVDVEFTVNHFPHQGHNGIAIPIKAGTTRQIPLTIYNFQASGAVNVVAYGL